MSVYVMHILIKAHQLQFTGHWLMRDKESSWAQIACAAMDVSSAKTLRFFKQLTLYQDARVDDRGQMVLAVAHTLPLDTTANTHWYEVMRGFNF